MRLPFDDKEFDPFNTKTMDNRALASRPGKIVLSETRLRRMHPNFYDTPHWMVWRRGRYERNQYRILQVTEGLKYGLAEPAIVHCLDPLLIAVYSAELDAVAFVVFVSHGTPHPVHGKWYPEGLADELIERHQLRENSRLLAVNTFFWLHEEGYAPDLRPGPKARGVYGNFSPEIADFLALDMASVEKRKANIEEHEWQRCYELMEDYFTHVEEMEIEPRDGRPLLSHHGHKQQWLPGHAPAHLSSHST